MILADILTEDDFYPQPATTTAANPTPTPNTTAATQDNDAGAATAAAATTANQDTFARALPDGRQISDRQPSLIVGGVLRSYQLVGIEWLKV